MAELNLIAGRRSKVSTAYVSALSYLSVGRCCLTTWTDSYDLIFAIELSEAECELLTADMMAAEKRLSMLARRAKANSRDIDRRDPFAPYLYTTLDRSDRAVEVCLEYLRHRALIGRRNRPTMKCSANTIESGPRLEAGD